MKIRSTFFAALVLATGIACNAFGQEYRVSKPNTFKNLSIFLIHGADQNSKNNILTLQEAMENKDLVVYETSDVNELAVENRSKTYDVFIQSGDIVKGGKQDRVLGVSIIIPANSGRILIQAFCVESGRWQKRGKENAAVFESSNDRIVTRDLKLAANKSKSQQDVWTEVSRAQEKLSKNVGAKVSDGKSETSLQLSLENKSVKASIDQYLDRLESAIDGNSDVIGYAFAMNGRINSADIYVSSSLFRKLWLKMLRAAATEAVANLDESARFENVTSDRVLAFLRAAEKGKASEERVSAGTKVVTREDKDNVLFEAVDSSGKIVVHKNYLSKH